MRSNSNPLSFWCFSFVRSFVLLFCLLLVPCSVRGAGLATSPWKITADSFQRSAEGNEVVAQGNVILANQGDGAENITLQADWLRYNGGTGLVHARGNVQLTSGGQEATASDVRLQIAEQTGELENSTVFFPQRHLYFSSELARKEGEDVYYFHNGIFTTCAVEDDARPMWSIKAVEADIDIDGFIFMKHCILRLKDVPILYLPIITFPGHRDRQTGFMVPPEFSSSDRSGWGLTTPFFVNLSPSADFTFYPSYLQRRGAHLGAEFRQVYSYETRLGLQASFLHDRLIDQANTADDDSKNYKDDPYLRTRRERYWLRGKFDHFFADNFNTMVDVDLASDRDFLMEFENELAGFNAANRQFGKDFHRGLAENSLGWRDSTLQVNRWWDTMYLGGEAVLVDEHDSHATQGQDAIATLPHLLNNGMIDLPGTPLNVNWDADYVNYYRDEGVGIQRMDLYPRLLAPLPVGRYFEGSILGGARETYYVVEEHGDAVYLGDTSPHRSVVEGKVDLATSLQRDYDLHLGSMQWFNHMLRPHVNYTHLSHSSGQEKLPDFDSKDRLASANSVGYGLDNHFRVGGWADEESYNRYWGLFKVSQSYNFQQSRPEHPYSEVLFNLEIYPLEKFHLKYDTSLDVYGKGFTQYDLLARYSQRHGALALDYRYVKYSDIHEVNGILEVSLTDRLSFKGELKQSLVTNRTIRESVSLLYVAGCWGIQLVHSKNEDDRRLAIYFSLVGAGRTVGLGYTDDLRGSYGVGYNDANLGHGVSE